MWWRDDFYDYGPEAEYGMQALFASLVEDPPTRRICDLVIFYSIFIVVAVIVAASVLSL
jgi:hypothetical protein